RQFQSFRWGRRQCPVGLRDQSVLEQSLIAAAGLRSLQEDEQTCGDPVETMDGYEVRQIEVDAQAGDDAYANEPAVGGGGEEMGLDDDEQVRVLGDVADLDGDTPRGRDRTMEGGYP